MMLRKLMIIVIATLLLTTCATLSPLREGIADFKSQKYPAAFSRLYPLAIKGNSDAQYAVGYILYYGKAGVQDRDQGVAWIRKAALQGNVLAQQALGIIYARQNFAPERDY